MCFHVSTKVKRALKSEHKGGFRIVEESERYGAYDHPDLPATLTISQAEPQSLQWGLIPHWARNEAHARELQAVGRNARCETMFDKPMFRDAARDGRCLIWLDGFFEWQHRGKKKVQYFIHMPGNALFPVAGLRSTWTDPVSGQRLETCTIVTTAANELMSEIHNTKLRMPAILLPDHQERWLDPATGAEQIQVITRPLPDGFLIAEEVVETPELPVTGTSLSLF
jgi:putative SOS response-associated peptidase YedK